MDYDQARAVMVESQLRTNRIEDSAVLEAMATIPRECFLPKALRGIAYADEDLLLPDGQFLIEPLAIARLLQAASIQADDVVLVIGCGTGYVAAVTAQLGATVLSMLADQEMVEQIQPILDDLEADNVVTAIASDPLAGDPSQAPFDVILIVGALPEIPENLSHQLGDGGRLVAILGDGRVGRVVLATKIDGVLAERVLFDARVPSLPGVKETSDFAF